MAADTVTDRPAMTSGTCPDIVTAPDAELAVAELPDRASSPVSVPLAADGVEEAPVSAAWRDSVPFAALAVAELPPTGQVMGPL